jgi:hypothetical protein
MIIFVDSVKFQEFEMFVLYLKKRKFVLYYVEALDSSAISIP